jgi:hypothetical protein
MRPACEASNIANLIAYRTAFTNLMTDRFINPKSFGSVNKTDTKTGNMLEKVKYYASFSGFSSIEKLPQKWHIV